jgi:hypothetical protein
MPSKTFNVLKYIFLLIGLFVLFILAASYFVDNEFGTERSVVINESKQEVFNYIRYLRNQDFYSVWTELDPEMNREYTGRDGTVGFVSAWDGNDDVGKGEQEIVGITEGERIDFELRFQEPFESKADAYFITESSDTNQTRVTWGFKSSMPRPMNLMLLFMDMEQMIGDDYETGLANLKEILEAE